MDLEILRHSVAHLMAQAVSRLYKGTKLAIGPSIENGFYHDFYIDKIISINDLEIIEKEMHKIVDQDIPIVKEVWDREQAIKHFEKNQPFTHEIIGVIPQTEDISIYKQGEFLNMCRGPHVSSTGAIGHAFKLTKVSGVYWRGDSKNQQLQRIYGTAWSNQEDLDQYLNMIKEAEERNHLKLGKEMDLFHFQSESPGAVFWHDKGWTIYQTIVTYIRNKIKSDGYIEVNTPQIISTELWKKSGHMDKYNENMFLIDHGNIIYGLKPMNCPCHVQIFNKGITSYKDLPIRMAEFGSCARNEPSGSLSGLMRVRQFVQDDAHIFCTPEQVKDEAKSFCNLLKEVYKDFGMECVLIRLSTRPEKRIGSDEIWDLSENALKEAAENAGIEYQIFEGEGAFYGPKLEFVLKDALGRLLQCGTLQLDYVLPERLDAKYIGEDGKQHHPIMLHRAMLGSIERFIGVLLEHYGGHLPLWLAPVQAVITTISESFCDYAKSVLAQLSASCIRITSDFRNEKISYKIREHITKKIPIIIIIGKKEMETNSVTIRCNNEQSSMSVEELSIFMNNIIANKTVVKK